MPPKQEDSIRGNPVQAWAPVLGIILLTACVFLPSLSGEFTNWDDDAYVTKNEKVRHLNMQGIKDIFTSLHRNQYKPLTFFSFAIEYHFVGYSPFLYHLDNLLLHIVNTVLVFFLFMRVGKKRLVAIAVTVLFAIHPLHVESVAWVTERKDVLYSLFFLSALLCYVYYKDTCRRRYFILSIAFLILSLISKQQGILFVVVLLLFDWLHFKDLGKRVLLEKIPFLLITAAFLPILLKSDQATPGSTAWQPWVPLFSVETIQTTSYAMLWYPYKLLIPVKLSCLYILPQDSGIATRTIVFLSPFLLALLGAAIWYSARFSKAILFGALFYVITIAVVLRSYPAGFMVVADRYSYIASIGIFYVLAEAIVYFYNRYKKSFPGAAVLMGVIAALGVSLLAYSTWQRCGVWKNSQSLWSNAIAVQPGNAIAHNNLAGLLSQQGNLDGAIAHCIAAIRSKPDYAIAYNNMAVNLNGKGRYEEAAEYCQKAIRLYPSYADAHFTLGISLSHLGKMDDAIKYLAKAVAFYPEWGPPYQKLGELLMEQNRIVEAVSCFQKLLSLNPRDASAYNNLGVAFARLGKFQDAVAAFGHAAELNPNDPAIAYNLRSAQHEDAANK